MTRFVVIYMYQENKMDYRHPTNLSFFLKYGLERWTDVGINITYLFVLKGNQCQVILPKQDNVHTLPMDPVSHAVAWTNAIKYLESLDHPLY
jgi:hypothetical protein